MNRRLRPGIGATAREQLRTAGAGAGPLPHVVSWLPPEDVVTTGEPAWARDNAEIAIGRMTSPLCRMGGFSGLVKARSSPPSGAVTLWEYERYEQSKFRTRGADIASSLRRDSAPHTPLREFSRQMDGFSSGPSRATDGGQPKA